MRQSDDSPRLIKHYSRLYIHNSESHKSIELQNDSIKTENTESKNQSKLSLPSSEKSICYINSPPISFSKDNQQDQEESKSGSCMESSYKSPLSLCYVIMDACCYQMLTKSGYSVTERGDKFNQKLQQVGLSSQNKEQLSVLLFFKYMNLIRLLSTIKFSYVATYSIKQAPVINSSNKVEDYRFSFTMDKGSPSFLFSRGKNYQGNFVQHLWGIGKNEMTSWLHSILSGVVELLKKNIFNCDICFRNTIKTYYDKQENYTYKMIDFDLAHELSEINSNKEQISKGSCSTSHLIRFWMKQKQNPKFSLDIYRKLLFVDIQVRNVEEKVKQYLEINLNYMKYCQEMKEKVETIRDSNQQESSKVKQILKLLYEYCLFYYKVQIIKIVMLAFQKRSLKECSYQDFIEILTHAVNIKSSSSKQQMIQSIESLDIYINIILSDLPELDKNSSEKVEGAKIECQHKMSYSCSQKYHIELNILENEGDLKKTLITMKKLIEISMIPEDKHNYQENDGKNIQQNIIPGFVEFKKIYLVLFRHYIRYQYALSNFSLSVGTHNVKKVEFIIESTKQTNLFQMPFDRQIPISNQMLYTYLNLLLQTLKSIQQIVFNHTLRPTDYDIKSSSSINCKLGQSFFQMAFKDSLLGYDQTKSKKPLNPELKQCRTLEIFVNNFRNGKINQELSQIISKISRTVFMAELLNEFQNFVLKYHRRRVRIVYTDLYNSKITPKAHNWFQKALHVKSTEKQFIDKQIDFLNNYFQLK